LNLFCTFTVIMKNKIYIVYQNEEQIARETQTEKIVDESADKC